MGGSKLPEHFFDAEAMDNIITLAQFNMDKSWLQDTGKNQC